MSKFDRKTAGFVAQVTAALLGVSLIGALAAQHVFKIAPCPLCLQQRWPYYIGITLALGVAYLDRRDFQENLLKCMTMTLALLMALSLFLALRHSGVEWGYLPAPSDCTASKAVITDVKQLQSELKSYTFVPCDRPGWKLFGIFSFANLNALLSAFLLLLNGLVLAGYDPRKLYGSRTVSQ